MMQRILVEVAVIKLRQVTAVATKANKETVLAHCHHSRNAHCTVTWVANPVVPLKAMLPAN